MKETVQIKHPAGKRGVAMDHAKYNSIIEGILFCLKQNNSLTHAEMHEGLKLYFKKNKIRFEGSVEWHMEWVKLDLESRKVIIRVKEGGKLKFKIA